MERFARGLACALMLAGTILHAGCGNSASSLTTGSTGGAPALGNQDPMARPVSVAWTSARAQRCGFYFDPAKLKVNYLSYERAQGADAGRLALLEKSYDSSFKVTSDRVSSDPDYCTDRRGLDIKADLQRHLAGDYAPNLPAAKPVVNCGFFGCPESVSNEPFDSKKFWQEKDKDPKRK